MKALKYWWPAIVWAGLLFFFSTGLFGSSFSSRFLYPFFRWLLPHAGHEVAWQLVLLTRKSAHFANYFVFSLLLLRGVRGEARGWRWTWALEALLLASGYALSDEFHQAFVPGRAASMRDVWLDSAGALVAQLCAALFLRKSRDGTADERR
jgi:VanZ family protein